MVTNKSRDARREAEAGASKVLRANKTSHKMDANAWHEVVSAAERWEGGEA